MKFTLKSLYSVKKLNSTNHSSKLKVVLYRRYQAISTYICYTYTTLKSAQKY